MDRDLCLILFGWALGLGSGVILSILNHLFALWRDRNKRKLDKEDQDIKDAEERKWYRRVRR